MAHAGALQEKPTRSRSVDSFGGLPLSFFLFVDYYGTNCSQCCLHLDNILLQERLQIRCVSMGPKGGRMTCLCLWVKVVNQG